MALAHVLSRADSGVDGLADFGHCRRLDICGGLPLVDPKLAIQ
jgi:hypothetical protein